MKGVFQHIKLFLIAFLVVLIAGWGDKSVQAQDIHLSQFYSSPLTLNPGMTGPIQGGKRVVANFKNQWISAIEPYQTYAVSFDMNLWEEELNGDYVGLGGLVYNDRSGEATYNNSRVMFSGAYHMEIKSAATHNISLGFQSGIVHKRFDLSNATYPNDWTESTGFAPHQGGDVLSNDNITYFDISSGMFYHGDLGSGWQTFGGLVLFHAAKPDEAFSPSLKDRIHQRFVAHGGFRFDVIGGGGGFSRFTRTNTLSLVPNVIFMLQGGHYEVNLGTSAEYDMGQTAVALGGYYRLNDAAIIATSIQYRQYKLGLSYDVNVQNYKIATNYRGGLELSFTYRFGEDVGSGFSRNLTPRF